MLQQEKFAELKSGASGQLPSPRGAALSIIELCRQNDVSLPEIIRVIKTDPGLVGRVLKIANSPVFGRPRPAVSLSPDILISIGIQTLRQVVLAFSLVSANRQGHCKNFDYDSFWSQSLAMGVAAQLISGSVRIAPPVEMFTCGLLAQIGRLGLASIHPERYSEVLSRAQDLPAERLLELEREQFGMTHYEVSAAMMADWGIPKVYTDCVLHHESPEEAGISEDSRSGRMLWAIHLAKQLSTICGLQERQGAERLSVLYPVASKLGLDTETVVQLGNQMIAECEEWGSLLDIKTRNAPSFSELETARQKLLESAQEAPTGAATASEKKEGATILIVDDDATSKLILTNLLNSAGYVVHTASNGEEAMRMALEIQPQVIITDWVMPGMDGLQMIRALRNTDIGREIYYMVLTALLDDEALVDAFNAGADDFLVKPINAKILHARLEAGLRTIMKEREIVKERDQLRRDTLELTIANQRAEAAALTDSLTGLYNRRYAMERLAKEWESSSRHLQPLSVLMLDIDHFKSINDTYGHHVGDTVLRRFSEMLSDLIRSPDVACRIGGEEFCIIVSSTVLAGAVSEAERIRKAIQNTRIEADGGELKLTVSIGVAQRASGVSSPEELLNMADEALYQAKRKGRNCVVATPTS